MGRPGGGGEPCEWGCTCAPPPRQYSMCTPQHPQVGAQPLHSASLRGWVTVAPLSPTGGTVSASPTPEPPPQSSALQRGTLAPGGVSALRGRSWKASPAPTPPPAAASAVCGAGPTPPGGRTDSTQQPHTAAVTPMTNTRGNGRGGSLCTLPSPHSLGCPAGAGGGTGACRAGIVPLPPSVSSKCQHFS